MPEIDTIPLVIDRQNQFGRTYQPQSDSGFLIRPDGYIGYRADTIQLEKLIQYLARILGAGSNK